MATEAVDRAMHLATVHRKLKKQEYRALWIVRLGAACKANGITYSRFVQGLSKAHITLNRKVLSDIAIRDPEGFKFIVEQAKASLS
jgi:large subunit ribosomal protein L20